MIDLRQVVQDRENELSGLIDNRVPQTQQGLQNLNPQIESFRGQTLASLAGVQGVDPTALRAESLRAQGTLGNRLQSLQQGRLANVGRNSVNLKLEQRLRKIGNAQGEQNQLRDFSRQNSMDQILNQQESQETQRQFANANQREDMARLYAQQGVDVQNQFDNQDSGYQAALNRALFGLTGAIGTGYLMRQKNPTLQSVQTNPNAYTGIGPQQNQGYYPQKPSFLY